jgi:hypothetical protein
MKNDYRLQAAAKLIPDPAVQRQDSLTDQMVTLMDLARRAGCYDAADWLQQEWLRRCELHQPGVARNHR